MEGWPYLRKCIWRQALPQGSSSAFGTQQSGLYKGVYSCQGGLYEGFHCIILQFIISYLCSQKLDEGNTNHS